MYPYSRGGGNGYDQQPPYSSQSAFYPSAELHGRLDQASLLRQEQLSKSRSLQYISADANSRHSDYGVPRSTSLRHTAQVYHQAQDPTTFATLLNPDPRSLHLLSDGSSYGGVHNPSILGPGPPRNVDGAVYGGVHNPSILGPGPRRNVDDAVYVHASWNPGYGVSLPPGRDYGVRKGLHNRSIDSDYPSPRMVRAAHSRIDNLKDERLAYNRELEWREKEREEQHENRVREIEREWERERDRQRARERDKARERERQGASLTKDGESLRRKSSHEASHRPLSIVKDRRRGYVCKVYSSRLAGVERDYLSLNKRYPRLVISPECSKVVVNWPKGNLTPSLYTSVSFEHDFVEDDAAKKIVSVSRLPAGELVKPEPGNTVWNSRVILMSGLSQNALEELSSERIYGERIPHLCNMLRFAVLKKDKYFMAIGGSWDPCDGGDPSVDDYSIVQTIIRCAKEIAHLDLKSCKNWNRFLEIHYDRVGKDGLFSHKEVTVLYIPDLSDCLPSLDSWRDQWLARKKSIDERERLQTPRKQTLSKLVVPSKLKIVRNLIELEPNTSQEQDKQTGKKADQTSSTSGAATEKQKISLHDDTAKSEEKGLLKDEKEREGRCGKAGSKGKSGKDLKENKRTDEPPRHPGFILQTTGSKDVKMHSLSLSLDSLLDYSDEDIQESTFEISLFAESFYEMLQYEMGSRLLIFLEKLHIRFVNKRNERERSRDVCLEKESEETSGKRVKIDVNDGKSEKREGHAKDHIGNVKCILTDEKMEPGLPEDDKMHGTEEVADQGGDPEGNLEDDLEELPEEEEPEVKKKDEKMVDAGFPADLPEEIKVQADKVDVECKGKDKQGAVEVNDIQLEAPKGIPETKQGTVEVAESKIPKTIVNKELLQAFRFFDRNRVGYIRVEDMRLIIHSMGKLLSHNAVKEMVMSALLESSTVRDDRILYEKLVTTLL